jgi:hypothetical protein
MFRVDAWEPRIWELNFLAGFSQPNGGPLIGRVMQSADLGESFWLTSSESKSMAKPRLGGRRP